MTAPILRFKDQGRSYPDWVQKKLKDCVTFSKGGSLSKSDLSPYGATPCLLYGELYTTYGEVTKVVINKTDSTEDLVKSQMNDVILPMSGETAEDIAKATCIKQEGVAYGGDLMVLRSKCLDGCFLSYSLNSVNRRQISRIAQGKTVVHINPSRVSDISINIACLEEQQKIAAFFTALDEKIQCLDEDIKHWILVYKYFLKKLFVGEVSFDNGVYEWNRKKLKEVAPLQRGFDLPSSQIKIGKYNVIYSNGQIAKHDTYKCEGCAVVTGRSGTIGNVFYMDNGKYWPHNTTLWVTDFCGNEPKFIYYLYKSIGLEKFSTGTGVPTLNRNEVHDFIVGVPPIFQQVKIASFLDAISLKIDLIKERKNKIIDMKRGFMQQMFV